MSDKLFKRIEVSSTAEIIAERFDDALDLMHKDAVVYGGAIRDIAAGLPILGDLDIAAAGVIFDHTVSFFRMSSKWTEIYTGPGGIPRPRTFRTKSGKKYPSPRLTTAPITAKSHNPYIGKAISAVISFKTFDNAKVQIMRSTSAGPSMKAIQSVFEIVKNVDICCCGLVLDTRGNVYEVVEGAYQDCIDRILRVNRIDDGLDLDYLKARIKKLKKRGWTSKINVSSIKTRLTKKKREKEKARAEQEKRQAKRHQYNDWLTIAKSPRGGQCVILDHKLVREIGNFGRVENIVRTAGDMRGVRIHRNQPQEDGTWKVEVSSGVGASRLCKELTRQIKGYLSSKKHIDAGIDPPLIPKKGKAKTKKKDNVYDKYTNYAVHEDPGFPKVKQGFVTEHTVADRDVEYFAIGSDSEVEPAEPPEAAQHPHHFVAKTMPGGEIHIDTTNRDIDSGRAVTIDISCVPGDAVPEIKKMLRNYAKDLAFDQPSRGIIRAIPREEELARGEDVEVARPAQGGIVIPEDGHYGREAPAGHDFGRASTTTSTIMAKPAKKKKMSSKLRIRRPMLTEER